MNFIILGLFIFWVVPFLFFQIGKLKWGKWTKEILDSLH